MRHDENGVLAGAQSAYHVHSGKQPFSWKGWPAWLAKVQRACNAPPAVSTESSIQMIRFTSLSSRPTRLIFAAHRAEFRRTNTKLLAVPCVRLTVPSLPDALFKSF